MWEMKMYARWVLSSVQDTWNKHYTSKMAELLNCIYTCMQLINMKFWLALQMYDS